jgi:hypothetical protein
MGKIKTVEPVKLISGFIYADQPAFEAALELMEERFGPVEFESGRFDFSYTTYYEKEMGPGLKRAFASFEKPILPDRLSECKLASDQVEKRFLNPAGGRIVNIDPGVVSLANLVLASTKEYSHRLYLGDGIFGEVTLLYESGTFVPLKWTYPDYQREDVIKFLIRVRDSLKEHIIAWRQKTA